MPLLRGWLSFLATTMVFTAVLFDSKIAAAEELNLTLDGFGGAFRQGHGITVAETETWLRTTPKVTLPPFGTTGFIGVGGKLGFIFKNRWIVDIASLRVATAFGPGSRTYGSIDGTIATAQPWTTIYGGLSAGFGARAKIRRFQFAAIAHVGASIMSAQAVAMAGGDEIPLEVEPAFSALLHVELEGCRRIDPSSRICIAVRPHIYDFGWMNGGSIALRWELGP